MQHLKIVFQPMIVILCGKIRTEMGASAFLPPDSRPSDKLSDLQEVAKFPEGAIGNLPDRRFHLITPGFHLSQGMAKTVSIAQEPHILPHLGLESLSNGGHVQLRRLDGRIKGENLPGKGGSFLRQVVDVVGDSTREDDGFEEGVAREAVGSVNSRAGDLADRIKPLERGMALKIRSGATDEVVGRGCDR